MVRLLIAKGANLDAKDVTDVTPLHLAVLGQHEPILELLIAKGADVDSLDADRITALDDATRRRYAGVVEILKRAGAQCGTNDHYSRDCKLAGGSE